MQGFNARMPFENKLRLTQLLALRILTPFVTYFFLSAFYAMLTLAFQAPFSRYYGHAGFVIYWMLSWVGMLALGGAMEAMITLLGPAFMCVCRLLATADTGSSFFVRIAALATADRTAGPLDHRQRLDCVLSDRHVRGLLTDGTHDGRLPGVFAYGRGMPFAQVKATVQALLLNTKNEIGLNFGVLIAWAAVSMLVTMPLFTTLKRRLAARKAQQEQDKRANKA